MNSTRYRIIFNRARGQLMAVAETASAHGGGHGRHTRPGTVRKSGGVSIPKMRITAVAASALVWQKTGLKVVSQLSLAGATSLFSLSLAHAQIVVDATAPANQRPTVSQDSLGRPQVNIQTPSSGGVSRNTYSQFDVQAKGAVLNNDRASNAFLASGAARVILNEVNSTNPSLLNGPITVNGTRAQVIVANPAGIKVDGGSFINASRATLTTGTAVMNNGQLTGFDVRQGSVEINGAGLNVFNVPYTDILARAAKLTGSIRAAASDEIAVVAGNQVVDYALGQVTANVAAGTQPTLAIDTSSLGGMYAGKITLLSTEAGVGVRNAGKLQAYATGSSQIIVTADGRLENTGTLTSALTSVATVSGDIVNSGIMQGTKVLAASAGADLRLSGQGMDTTSASAVALQAQRDVILTGARVASTGTTRAADGIVTNGQISISAGRNVDVTGSEVRGQGEVRLSGKSKLTLKDSTLSSISANVVGLSESGISLANTQATGKRVQLETGAVFRTTTSSIDVTGGKLTASEQLNVVATGDVTVSDIGKDALTSEGGLNVVSGGATVIRSSIAAGTSPHVSAAGDAAFSGENVMLGGVNVSAAGDLTVEASKFNVLLSSMAKGTTPAFESAKFNIGQTFKVYAPAMALLNGVEVKAKHVNIGANDGIAVGYWEGVFGGAIQRQASKLTSDEDIFLINLGVGKTLSIDGAAINGGGKVSALSNGALNFNSTYQKLQVKGSDVSFQGAALKVAPGQITATTGHVELTATKQTAQLGATAGGALVMNAGGNVAFHGNGDVTLQNVYADARGNMSVTSANGLLNTANATLQPKKILTLSSKGAQKHEFAMFSGDTLSLYNQTGDTTLFNTSFSAGDKYRGNVSKSPIYGNLSLETGGTFKVSGSYMFSSEGDLSIVTGAGNISLVQGDMVETTPGFAINSGYALYKYGLTLMARNGDVTIRNEDVVRDRRGTVYPPVLEPVDPEAKARSINLVGNNVSLRGYLLGAHPSGWRSVGTINLVATTGNVDIRPYQITTNINGLQSIEWTKSELNALFDVDIRAANDVTIDGLSVNAGRKLNIQAGRHVAIGGKIQLLRTDERASGGWLKTEEWVDRTVLRGTQGVTIGAGTGSIGISGTDISAPLGNVQLVAEGNLDLRTAFTQRWYERVHVDEDDKLFYTKVITRYYNDTYIDSNPVSISGGDVSLQAKGDVSTEGTQLTAKGNFRLDAGGKANYFKTASQFDSSVRKVEQRDWSGLGAPMVIVAGKKISRSTERSTEQRFAELGSLITAQNDILSVSGDDQLLQGTKLIYGGTATFGFGPNAKADAKIILEGVKSRISTVKTRESDWVVWQRQMGSGSTIETLTLPSFNGPTKPVFNGPVLSQIAEGDFKAQVLKLSAQPGLSYLNDLSKRTDVQWQPVKLAYDKWEYKQEGLTQAGAALVAVAVTIATAGADGGSTGASIIGASATSTAGLMANAAFASLASQAAISFINNKGDIGKTLKDMGRSDTVKAALAAAATAGVLDKIGALDSMKNLKASPEFTDKLTRNLINAGGRALTSTAISGGNLADAFKSAIIGAAVDTAHGAVASEIKVLEADYLAHKLAHAIAGCVAGVAAQGTCKDGAIGGAVGEIVAGFVPPANGMFYTEAEKNKVLGLSKIVAGAVSAYNGGNAQTAITTAETAVSNNAFFVPPLVYWLATAAGAYITGVGGGNPVTGLQAIGQGADPLSKAITNGTQAAVTLSMQSYPKETTATLTLLSSVAEKIDATVSYVDSATGKVVSSNWNNLSPGTRDALIGAGKVTSVVLSPVGVSQVKGLITKMPQAVARKLDVAAEHALLKSGGVIDSTGQSVLDMKKLSTQQKALAGDLFGSNTVKQIVPDGEKLARMPSVGETGIDDLYKVNRSDVDYVVVEYKFVGNNMKSGSSQLGTTSDGVQGSTSWITGSDRLERAIGSERQAVAVRDAVRAGRIETYVVTTRANGATEIEVLDALGKVKKVDTSKIVLPKINLSGARP